MALGPRRRCHSPERTRGKRGSHGKQRKLLNLRNCSSFFLLCRFACLANNKMVAKADAGCHVAKTFATPNSIPSINQRAHEKKKTKTHSLSFCKRKKNKTHTQKFKRIRDTANMTETRDSRRLLTIVGNCIPFYRLLRVFFVVLQGLRAKSSQSWCFLWECLH